VVASIAAAAAAASSVGVKPQAEAPHSAPVAPRNALRRRLRRRTCTARARAPRHRSVLRGHELARLRVRAQLLRSARASRRAAKGAGKSMASGWRRRRPPTRLEPAAAGRGGARMRAERKKKVSLNVAMESAILTPALSHETVDIRAVVAAYGQATAASAVA